VLFPDPEIVVNLPEKHLPDNRIRTNQYQLWNFFPVQIFEQFSKLANLYFLV
jgi:phospholipid-transporting ATPase